MYKLFAGIMVSGFAINVMQLILATALPTIVNEIGGQELYSFVFSAYMIASIIAIPIFSKLADVYGKKKFFIIGAGSFAVSCFLGGFVETMEQLILLRVIQGFCAGIIIPVSLALISDIFPEEIRGKMIGSFGIVQLVSNLISPQLGTLITIKFGWQWIFFQSSVLVIIAILLVLAGKTKSSCPNHSKHTKIDFGGSILLGLFCVLIVVMSKMVNNYFDHHFLLLLILTLLILAVFLMWEKKQSEPILKLEFFTIGVIRKSIISSLIGGAIVYGLITILPLLNGILVKDKYTENEGILLFIFMIGVTIGMVIFSRLIHKNSRIFVKMLWFIAIALSSCLVLSIQANNLTLVYISIGVFAVSAGGITVTALINSQNNISSEDRTVLSGFVQLARYFGAAIGVTIFTNLLPNLNYLNLLTEFSLALGFLIPLSIVGFLNEIVG